jgi:hypothetical protein
MRLDVATAYFGAGLSQIELDRASEGREQLTQAMTLLERLVEEDPARAEYRLALARSSRILGLIDTPLDRRATPGAQTGESEQLIKRAAGLLDALVHEHPENREYRMELAMAQDALGNLFLSRNQLGAAEQEYRRSADSYRSLLEPSPSARDVDLRVRMAKSLQNLAVIVQQTDHRRASPGYYAESRRLLTEALKIEPRRDEATLALGATLLNWGIFCSFDPALRKEAEEHLAEAIERLRPVVEREPSWTQARMFLYNGHGGMAQWLEGEDRHAEAARHWEQVVSLAEPGQKEHLQFFLTLALARGGEHRKAWALVQSLEPSLDRLALDYAYQLTKVCSTCLGAADEDPSLSAADRTALQSRYGDKGAALIRRCLERTPAADLSAQRQQWRQDKDLTPLQRRADVQALLADSRPVPAVKSSDASTPRGSK